MNNKEIVVAFYRRNFLRDEWRAAFDKQQIAGLIDRLGEELFSLGYSLKQVDVPDMAMDISGYGDLLNSVRIRCPQQGVANMCLGHIIGKSAHLNLAEDIRRGVNRVAFAPETIEPEGSDKVVCHNCGCGC
jgi:hypothetical protein